MMVNDSGDAVGAYTNCTTLDPTNFMAWDSLGRAYMGQGNYPQALAAYTQGTVLTVKNATLWNDKGKVLVLMGSTSDALQCFDKALGIDPNFADAEANHDSLYGVMQVVNITGTVTPTATINRIGTFYTTVIPTETVVSPVSTTSTPAGEQTSPVPVTTVTVAKKTTFSPLSPLAMLCAVIAVVLYLIPGRRQKK